MRLIYLPVICLGFNFNCSASYEPDGSYAAHKPVSKNFGNYPLGYDVKGITVTKYTRSEPKPGLKKKYTTLPLQFNRPPLSAIKEEEDEEVGQYYSDPLVGRISLDRPAFLDEEEK